MKIRTLRNWMTIIVLLATTLVGCSSLGQVSRHEVKPVVPEELPSGNGWWHARFRMNWPPETEPIWHMDLYLAHQVIMPVLDEYKGDIYLWRFHRRANRDGHGRQFTFWFYSTPRTAQQIFEALKTDPIIIDNLADGFLGEVVYSKITEIKRPNIEDTSDPKWPDSIQKTWPYYIEGVSRMWLDLVARVADDDLKDDPPASPGEIDSFYRQVNESVTELWQTKGRHAFMHHLNAVFGYEPLIYYEKRMMNF